MKTIVLVRWNMPFENSRYQDRIDSITSDPEWNRRRMYLFKMLTAPSLMRQTLKDFSVWVICDPDKGHQNAEVGRMLSELGDDRFRVVTDFDTEIWAAADDMQDDEELMIARIDSDDMYHRSLLDLFAFEPVLGKHRYVQAMRGHAYEVETGRFYHWENPSPPFFAQFITAHEIRCGYPDHPLAINHGQVAEVSSKLYNDSMFCVTLHGSNICNSRASSWLKGEVGREESAKLRAEYGMS